MNRVSTILAAMLFASPAFSQIEEVEEVEKVEEVIEIEESEEREENIIITEEKIIIIEEGEGVPDTSKMTIGKREVIIVTHEEDYDLDFDEEADEAPKKKRSDAHWAGLDLGFTMLMNDNFKTSFDDHPYWENDPARSQVWNLNFAEHKFGFGTPYVGLTTGLGFSFTSVAFKNDYLLQSTVDTLYAVVDTVNTYSKNKLKASYLTIPLLLEFNTNVNPDKSFYLAAGVVGGVRMTSKLKRNGEFDGKKFEQREKGTYSLNPFKLDGVVRLGYGAVGVFANYSLLPLFDTGKTVEVYPLTFGLSVNL